MEGKIDIKFEDGKLCLKIDSNEDGETLLDLKLDLSEAFDEIKDAFFKDEEKEEEKDA